MQLLEEIEKAILEEQEAKAKAEAEPKAEYPAYLDSNKVTLPLSEYMGLYESSKALNKLIDLVINCTELHYSDKSLVVSGYESEEIVNYIKDIEPLRYAQRYNTLLQEKKEK